MHTPLKILALLWLMAFAGCATTEKTTSQNKPGPPQPALTALEARLMGTWVLAKAAVPGSPSGIGIRRKIFTPGHWEMIQPNPQTGGIVFRHGGTYRLTGDELEQTVQFASEKTASFVHQVRRFKITVEGDTYTQVGIGNPFNEVWTRVAAASAADRVTPEAAKSIFHNLHQLAAGAEQYYLENQKSEVTYAELVGPGKIIGRLPPMAGEDYRAVVLRQGVPVILTLPTGETIAADPRQGGGATYVFHKVRPGDTADAIASDSGLTLQQLSALNPGTTLSQLRASDAIRVK